MMLRSSFDDLLSVDQITDAEHVEDAPLPLPSSADRRDGVVDSIGKSAEGKRLQPHFAGSGERGEEEPFAAEKGGFDLAYVLDDVVHRGLQCHQVASVDAQCLPRSKVEGVDRAAGMHETDAISLQALQ